jgi:hypothetical protein
MIVSNGGIYFAYYLLFLSLVLTHKESKVCFKTRGLIACVLSSKKYSSLLYGGPVRWVKIADCTFE